MENFQIDGADNNDAYSNAVAVNQGGVAGIPGTLVPIEALDEFSVETNASADAGRNAGGAVQMVIKSGTNYLHGSLFFFDRNEALAARSPVQSATSPVQEIRNNQFMVDPKDKDDVYIYISGTGAVRQPEELADCSGEAPDKDPNTALFRIDIIKVPLAHPELAKIVSSPRIFADPQTGALNGLWKGGKHGEGTQTTSETNRCHDITIYSALGLAAGACSGNGILLDISNPVNPIRIADVSDPNYAFWHSANFNNAGTKVLFTDEWGGGGQPRCRATDPMNWGADAIFELKNRKLTLTSYYKMPAPQTEFENCVAHNGSLVPIPGRDILVQSWYQGGISVVDFTDASHPFEIGYFDRGPIDGAKRAMGGMWSTYWYNGYIYSSEIARGVDVFKLVPNKYLTQNEIDASNQVHFDELNVQNQPKIIWPANFVVARAYIDQLARSGALTPQRVAALNASMDRNEAAKLKTMATSLEKDAASAKTPADTERMRALAAIMKQSRS